MRQIFIMVGGVVAITVLVFAGLFLLGLIGAYLLELRAWLARLWDRRHDRDRRNHIEQCEQRVPDVERARRDIKAYEVEEAQGMYRDQVAIALLPETRACPLWEQR